MAYRQDWILNQIEALVQFVAKLFFQKDAICYQIADPAHVSQADSLYIRLSDLLSEHKIGEAEDLLFEEVDVGSEVYLEIVLDFYVRLNALDEEELESAGFSREEIQSGLKDMLKRFRVKIPFAE